MRKIFLSTALAVAAVVGLVGPSTPAGALGVVDFGTTVVSDPGTVSPSGGYVRYVVGFDNSGLVAWDGTLTVTTTGGTFQAVDGDSAGCTLPAVGSAVSISCTINLAANEARTLGVVVRTPSTPGAIQATSTVKANPDVLGVLPDVVSTNNAATATTSIVDPTVVTGARGFLRPGDSLQWRNHVMTALAAYGDGGGVVGRMKDSVIGPGATCGDAPCSTEGLNYEFEQGNTGEAYEGKVAIAVRFQNSDPCYGYGAPQCYALYYRLPDPNTGIIDPNADGLPVKQCSDSSRDPKAPCLTGLRKVGSDFIYDVEALTNDPDIALPTVPINGLGK